jgi:hypothetical protein
MTTPLTQNSLDATTKAIGEFQVACGDAQSIYNQIDAAIVELTGKAMISQSGEIFGQAVNAWLEDFRKVQAELGRMEQALSDTVDGLRRNEGDLTQQAGGWNPSAGSAGGAPYCGPIGTVLNPA